MSEEMDAILTFRAAEDPTLRLLRHCLSLAEPRPRASARARLNALLGRDLADLLVRSLTARGAR